MTQEEIIHKVSNDFSSNIAFLKKELAVDDSFDLIYLEQEHGGRKMGMFLVDGFAKDQALTQIQRELSRTTERMLKDKPIDTLIKSRIPFVEIETTNDLDNVVDQVLAGPTALVVEGCDYVILLDTREYPVRGPEEPDTEQVIRGSKDGFVETLVMNAALIRRRVRDKTLRVEYVQVGRRSKTDIAITYIADIADHTYVEKIKAAIEKIDTDGLPMADKTIEEFIFGHHYNPYPLARYTERPDVAATHLFEGHVLIVVDGSPSVMITPTTFWHHMQHAEEYRQKPVIGAGLRLVRFAAVWASIFLLPLWYLLATSDVFGPETLSYIGSEEQGSVPLFAQFLIAEIGIEMLRMAAIHTPNALATALGLVSALLIGEVAIEVGLFSPEVVLYLAVAVVGSFATPSYEMGLANRFIRVGLLISAATFHLGGYVIGITLWILLLVRTKVLDMPYLWPFIPFNVRAMKDILFRAPMPLKNRRPVSLHPNDPDR
ncbi:spore germination protein [Bacillus sp. FJAT-45037]|uniref:spore germination protein n=1 Tax=Bacillus sp. FJAT-45037 TaxID=2011007 RepID=UPI000C2329A1|nr:spore germination protein [Bacillus sp. FJAT-45037]